MSAFYPHITQWSLEANYLMYVLMSTLVATDKGTMNDHKPLDGYCRISERDSGSLHLDDANKYLKRMGFEMLFEVFEGRGQRTY